MKHEHHQPHRGESAAGTAIDPVCGMTVKIEGGRHTYRHGTETHYFCSTRCREKFIAHPERFIEPAAQARAAEAESKARPQDALYTCPMHPEVVQVGPGNCPKCGMALEPRGVPLADAGPNPELIDFTHRLWIGAALTIPI
jgi:Cu+-exporting ATPase